MNTTVNRAASPAADPASDPVAGPAAGAATSLPACPTACRGGGPGPTASAAGANRRRAGWLLASAGVLLGVAATLRAFEIPLHHDQLLPLPALQQAPWTSLWYLHAQPPLLNAELALALFSERHFGIAKEASLACFQFACLLGTMHALFCLAGSLIESPRVRAVVRAIILLDPALYLVAFEWSYTLHEAVCLAQAALHVQRWSERHRTSDLSAVCLWLLALTLTRALFHPIWAVATVAVVVVCARGGVPRAATVRVAAVLLVFATTVFAWPLKNLAVFGFFGSSSWLGYNLARELPLALPPEWPLFDSRPTPAADRVRRVAGSWVPAPFAQVPALTMVEKPGRAPNWNHYWMLHASADLEHAALACIARDPWSFLDRAHTNYVERYAYSTLRHPYTGRLPAGADAAWMGLWMRGYETLTCGRVFDDHNGRPTAPLAYLLPVGLGLVLLQLAVARRRRPGTRPTVAFMLLASSWVLAMVVLVDGAEGNRMRISTQPLLVLAVAWAGEGIVRRRHPVVA